MIDEMKKMQRAKIDRVIQNEVEANRQLHDVWFVHEQVSWAFQTRYTHIDKYM